jgi:hypothetical protein
LTLPVEASLLPRAEQVMAGRVPLLKLADSVAHFLDNLCAARGCSEKVRQASQVAARLAREGRSSAAPGHLIVERHEWLASVSAGNTHLTVVCHHITRTPIASCEAWFSDALMVSWSGLETDNGTLLSFWHFDAAGYVVEQFPNGKVRVELTKR